MKVVHSNGTCVLQLALELGKNSVVDNQLMRLLKIHSCFHFCYTHLVHSSFSIEQFHRMIEIYFEPQNNTFMNTFTIILFLHTSFSFSTCHNYKLNLVSMTLNYTETLIAHAI